MALNIGCVAYDEEVNPEIASAVDRGIEELYAPCCLCHITTLIFRKECIPLLLSCTARGDWQEKRLLEHRGKLSNYARLWDRPCRTHYRFKDIVLALRR